MPNGVRARGNSRVANRRRNQQRDNAVRAELVQDAPPIVVEAEPISVQADPDTIQQLQQRIRELEAQVKKVKRNYKSAKKQADGADNMITKTSQLFKSASEVIGLTTDEMLTPDWVNNFKKAITSLKQKSDYYDNWQESIAEHDELGAVALEDIAEKIAEVDSLRKQKQCLRESCENFRQKYRMACEGTLLAFQETEIRDLQDENDKLMKLNKSLLRIKKKDKEDNELSDKLLNNMAEDMLLLLNKLKENVIQCQSKGFNDYTECLTDKKSKDKSSENKSSENKT